MRFSKFLKGVKNPSKAFKYVKEGGREGQYYKSHTKIKDYSLDEEFLEKLSLFFKDDLSKYHSELISNGDYQDLENKLIETKSYLGEFGITEARLLYVICRKLKPEIIIETGVASGFSSFIFLLAIEKNDKGRLISIDLPASKEVNKKVGQHVSFPQNRSVGWLVPQKLNKKWELKLGDSKKILPEILKEVKKCDLFLHDSDHSSEHMTWEYETVWPYLRMVLLSDDVKQNKAFDNFVSSHKCKVQILDRMGVIIPNIEV